MCRTNKYRQSWTCVVQTSVGSRGRVSYKLMLCFVSSQTVRGWLYHSDGRCTNTITGERVDTGVTWQDNSIIGVTACYDSGTVTFYKDHAVVHIFGNLRDQGHAFIELGVRTCVSVEVDLHTCVSGGVAYALARARAHVHTSKRHMRSCKHACVDVQLPNCEG